MVGMLMTIIGLLQNSSSNGEDVIIDGNQVSGG